MVFPRLIVSNNDVMKDVVHACGPVLANTPIQRRMNQVERCVRHRGFEVIHQIVRLFEPLHGSTAIRVYGNDTQQPRSV